MALYWEPSTAQFKNATTEQKGATTARPQSFADPRWWSASSKPWAAHDDPTLEGPIDHMGQEGAK